MRGTPPVSGHGNSDSVVGNIADLGNDLAALVELQAKLAAADLKECRAKAGGPMAGLAAAAILALAAVPIALLGLADVLAATIPLSAGAAKLVTAVFALVAAAVIVVAVRQSAKASMEPFRRSREELSRNLAWFRTVLLYSGRSVPQRRP